MKLINVNYFYNHSSFSADDLRNNKENSVNVNPKYILSLSGLLNFKLEFSGEYVGKYGLLTMANGDCYVMREKAYESFTKQLYQL